MPELLPASLTRAQRDAILHEAGPLLIVAGPGAGKTSVMVRRAAHLVLERGAAPEGLLVTTFTNKAADELYDRLYRFLGRRAHDVHISTIHSFCQMLLQRHPGAHPWGAALEVLDAQGQFLFVYAHLKDLGLSRFPKGRPGEFIADVVATFNLCTEERVDPVRFVATAREQGPELLGLKKATPEAVEEYVAVAEAYGRYRALLEAERVMDFATLQDAAYRMLTDRPEVLDAVRARYRHILVDEYQDTNRLQVELLKLVAIPANELCAVGDDDQSIYRFRGASVSSFLRFAEDFPGARRIDLDVNFRATPRLVAAASSLIAHNAPHRTEKELAAHRRPPEDPDLPPALVHAETAADEADAVVRTLVRWREAGVVRSYDDVALLFRSVKHHAGEYLAALDRHGVAYTVVADGGFFDREDVLQLKDLYTFCGWKHRWDPRFLEGKLLELSPRTLDAIRAFEEDPTAWTDDAALDALGVGDEAERALLRALAGLRRRTLEGEVDDLLRLFYELLGASGYFERCCRDGPCAAAARDRDAEAALLNLAQFSGLVAAFQQRVRSVNTYLLGQYLRTLPERSLDALRPEPDDEAVRVMTVHQAKGLEFPVVVIGSAMEGRFPGRFRPPRYPVPRELRLSGDADDADEHERDQRRLFYVAMTRAEDVLLVGAADKVAKRGGGPSRFLDEVRGGGAGDVFAAPAALEAEHAARQAVADAGAAGTADRSGRMVVAGAPARIPSATGAARRRKPAPARRRIGYSALHSYLLCPLQYKLTHECGFAVPEMHWFHFGAVMHRALEAVHRRALAGDPVDLAAVARVWREVWRPARSWSEKKAGEMERLGLRYLTRYASHHADRLRRVRWVEEPVELPVPLDGGEGDGLVVSGRLDLACDVEGGIEVIDFKVRKRVGLEVLQPEHQVRTYGLAVAEARGEPVARVALHLLGEEPGEDVIAWAWDDGVRVEAVAILERAAAGILSGRFGPTPGAHCALCDFRGLCPASAWMPAGTRVGSQEIVNEQAIPVGAAP